GKEKTQYFTETEQNLCEFMSILSGHTIENCLLYEEALLRKSQSETLLQVSELMAGELDTGKVISRMIEASYLLVNAERITLFVLDSEKDELVSTPSRSELLGGGTPQVIRIPTNKGIVGYVFSTNKTVRCADAQRDWRFDPTCDGLGFLMPSRPE